MPSSDIQYDYIGVTNNAVNRFNHQVSPLYYCPILYEYVQTKPHTHIFVILTLVLSMLNIVYVDIFILDINVN